MTDYPFVQAYHDYGPAKGPRLGITWHMAEGGGTVGYLSRKNPNGVSVHFVVERSGRIVQMLKLTHANGSIRPTAIRTTDDPPFTWAGCPVTYGATAAREALGSWWSDPNSATLGVEIEGFAKDGSNADQADAMAELWAYLLARYPGIRSLAHRDFADYKACPGKLVPWDRLGGHASSAMGDDMPLNVEANELKRIRIPKGTNIFDLAGRKVTDCPSDIERVVYHQVQVEGDATHHYYVGQFPGGGPGPDLLMVRVGTVTELGAPATDCEAAIADAIAKDRAGARIVWK